MAGLVPAIHEGPAHRRRQARKALRPSAFPPVAPRRDLFLRRPGVDGRDKPGHDGKGSTNEQQTGRPTDNAIRAKIPLLSRWLLWGRNREHGGGGGRRHQGVMAGLVPAIPEGPAHRRRQARKALRPSAFLPVAPRRDSFLRRPGVDGRDKPGHDGKGSTNEQQTGRPTDNAIRAQIRALIALAVVGKELGARRRWRTAPSRRHGRAFRPSPKAQRIYAGKREKPCDRPPSCRSRRGGTRSCGGPAWMAGTSPAMTARVR